MLKNSAQRMSADGLNTLKYKLEKVEEKPLVTFFRIQLKKSFYVWANHFIDGLVLIYGNTIFGQTPRIFYWIHHSNMMRCTVMVVGTLLIRSLNWNRILMNVGTFDKWDKYLDIFIKNRFFNWFVILKEKKNLNYFIKMTKHSWINFIKWIQFGLWSSGRENCKDLIGS